MQGCQNNTASGFGYLLMQRVHDNRFRRCGTRPGSIGGVCQKSQYTLKPQFSNLVDIHRFAIHRIVIELEVPGSTTVPTGVRK